MTAPDDRPLARRLAVIFDLDGVLADTEPLWTRSSEELLARHGARYDPRLKVRFMGRHPLEVARIMVEHYGLSTTAPRLLEERLAILRGIYAATPPAAVPGAVELVAALRRERVPLAVASGSPRALVAAVLQVLGLRRALPVFVGSDEAPRGKPAPDLFLEAARRIDAPAGRCVVVEDAVAGVEAAAAAKMACVALSGPHVPPSLLRAADLVVSSLTALTPRRLAGVVKAHAA